MKNKNYKCWWCGENGNSGEHKFKRTDLIGEFGATFSEKDNRPILLKNGKEYEIKSAKSKFVKFEKILCSDCNNNKSQDFDTDYTEFINYILNNYDYYKTKSHIDLKEIYPSNWKEKKRNIYSYFVKHFCTRLASNNIEISPKIVDFLNKKINYLEEIHFIFQQKSDLYSLFKLMENTQSETGFLEFGKLIFHMVGDHLDYAHTYLTRKWFRVEMYYSKDINSQNFSDLINYYDNSLIQFNTVSIVNIEGNSNLDDINELVKKIEHNSEKYIKNVFGSNPFKVK
jgi:hypothetical protein